jgi:hypothetical protein
MTTALVGAIAVLGSSVGPVSGSSSSDLGGGARANDRTWSSTTLGRSRLLSEQVAHSYDPPLAGGCRDSPGGGYVQCKWRDHVPTRAECQQHCDDEPRCTGYQ